MAALLMGWSIVTNGKSGAPRTWAISSAALTNRSVMMDTAGTPNVSAVTESCRLHELQLPQSPMPEITACQCLACSMMSGEAGAL